MKILRCLSLLHVEPKNERALLLVLFTENREYRRRFYNLRLQRNQEEEMISKHTTPTERHLVKSHCKPSCL